jgi:hypothetical protein
MMDLIGQSQNVSEEAELQLLRKLAILQDKRINLMEDTQNKLREEIAELRVKVENPNQLKLSVGKGIE